MQVQEQGNVAADVERDLSNQPSQLAAGGLLDRAFEQVHRGAEFGPLAAHQRLVGERSAGAQVDDGLKDNPQV